MYQLNNLINPVCSACTMSLLPSLTGPQITRAAIYYVQWNKIFIQSHVLFLGKYLFLQAPDIFLTISSSICGPGLLAQKTRPAGLDGITAPCSVALVGQTDFTVSCAENTDSFWQCDCSGTFLSFLIIPVSLIVTGILSASVRKGILYFAEVHRVFFFFFNLVSFGSALEF